MHDNGFSEAQARYDAQEPEEYTQTVKPDACDGHADEGPMDEYSQNDDA